MAIGIPPEVAQAVIVAREQAPFRNYQDLSYVGLKYSAGPVSATDLSSLPFFIQ